MHCSRIAKLALCFALLCAGPAEAQETGCEVVTRSLHVGAAPPKSLLMQPGDFAPFAAASDGQRENDVVAALQKAGATPGLLDELKQQAGCDTCGATLTWFPDHGAGVVFNEAGSADCVSVTAFKATNGHLDAVKVPESFHGDCSHTQLLMGRADRQIYLADESTGYSKDPAAHNVFLDVLSLSRWNNGDWDVPCQIREAFPMRFFELDLNCADGLDCQSLRKIAVADAASAQDESQRLVSMDKMQEYSRIMATFPAEVRRFPDFREKPHAVSFASDASLDLGPFSMVRSHPFGGGRLVSFISPENDPASLAPRYGSWIVTQWLEGAGPMHPVAGFVVHQKPGPISAVSIDPVPGPPAH